MKLLEHLPILISVGSSLLVGTLWGCGSEDAGPTYGDNIIGASLTSSGATAGNGTAAGTTGLAATTGSGTTSAGTTGLAATTLGTSGATTTGAAATGFGTTGAAATGFGSTGAPSTGGGTTGGVASVCNAALSGQDFYMQPTACVRCHGTDGTGVEQLGPRIRFPVEDYARWIIRNGRTDHPDFVAGMEGYAADCLTEAQLGEILAFLNSFPRPTDGPGLFAEFCANCHGPDGRGGVTERDLDGELHEIASITGEGANTSAYSERSEYMPVMTGVLSQAEIDLITQYLQNQLGLQF